MKLRIATLALGMVMGLSMIGGASAGPQDTPGTPGEKNCQGQTVAFLAQVGKEAGEPGLGNLADFAGLSVKELQELVRAFCAEEF